MEDRVDDATDLLVKHLPADLNILKVIEECAELQEVMAKYLTKSEQLKPKKEKIIEEMGDVIFRIIVASKLLNIGDEVMERVEQKGEIMYKWAIEKFKS